jgi:hypothetical protein
MKIYLTTSRVLTDEHPKAAKGKPVLVDLETWEVYHREDMIGAVSALRVVSLAVAGIGENLGSLQGTMKVNRSMWPGSTR